MNTTMNVRFDPAPTKAWTALLAAALLLWPGRAPAEVDFLVPGVSLKSVSFEEGASVSYLIISEAYGVRDTTMASLNVLEAGSSGILLEVSSSSWPVVTEETVTVRLEMLAGVQAASTPGEVREMISGVLVREGGGEFRLPDEEELDEFGIERLFLSEREEQSEEELPGREVETPAGIFDCDVTVFRRSATKRVDLGGVGAERFEEQTSTLMTSEDVPFWGLVKSRVEDSTWTRLDSSRRRGQPRPRVTVTESVLVSFRAPAAP